jgi:hypothetical protein
LAEHYRKTSQWRLCLEACRLARDHCAIGADPPGDGFGGDRLFVHLDVYQWRIAYEESIASFYGGDYQGGIARIDELLARTDLPPNIAQSVADNRMFYEKALQSSEHSDHSE